MENSIIMPSLSDREITSLVATATPYHGRSHILLPKISPANIVAVLSENADRKRDSMKISLVATKFGTGAHLILPADWTWKRVFVEREKRT